ncbi:MAG: 4Fe-4S dicluster domain-containing protein [Nitrospirae bacterium]|nr:4Fe-4S dicluster domain-containing protein [Nitrospirota bacterium]
MSEDKALSRRDLLKTGGAAAAATAVAGVLPISKAEGANAGLPRWAMIIDLRKCIGCRGCTVACKSEFGVPLGRWSAVVKQIESGKYPKARKDFLPRLCNHCSGGKEEVPPCVKICPQYPLDRKEFVTPDGKVHKYRDGATYKRPDGMVLFDNSQCIGCGKCIEKCPYGVRYFNPFVTAGKDNTKNGIGKCTLCQHRVDKGLIPSCVNTCQGSARIFGDLNDPDSEVSRLVKEFNLLKDREKTTLLPQEKTEPYVFYIDPKNVLKAYKINSKKKEAEFNDQII